MALKNTASKKVLVAYGRKKPPKAVIDAFANILHSDCVTVKAASREAIRDAIRKEKPTKVIYYEEPAMSGILVRERAADLMKSRQHPIAEEKVGLDKSITIKALAAEFQISMEILARILGVSARTLARWTSGETHKPHPAQSDRLAKTLELRKHMAKVINKKAFGKYLHGKNELFGGLRPLDLLMAGQFDRVIADIAGLEEGVFA